MGTACVPRHIENLNFDHAIVAAGGWRKLPDFNCAPWVRSNDPAAIVAALRATPPAERIIKFNWIERLIIDPLLAAVFTPGDPATMYGPGLTECVRGIVQNALYVNNAVGVMERLAHFLREAGITDIDVYCDSEWELGRWSNDAQFPGVWNLLEVSKPGTTPMERERLVRYAVYWAIRRALVQVGICSGALAGGGLVNYACADRVTGWGANPFNLPALDKRLTRSHIIYTTPDDATTQRMHGELMAGSGPDSVYVHLTTLLPPAVLAARLAICDEVGVRGVLIFNDDSVPGVDAPTDAQRQQAAIPRLNAMLSVVGATGV